MKFIPLVVLVLAGLAVSTAVSALPTDWKNHPYFDASKSELRLSTTVPGRDPECDWDGPRDGTFRAPVDSSLQPLDWADFWCTTDSLWAKTCLPGRQTVQFKKTMYLPGPAYDLDVSLVSAYDEPLHMAVEINGSLAMSILKSAHKRDLLDKQDLFKVGLNTITVEATKPKTDQPCNVDFDHAWYGVTLQMRALFAHDFQAQAIPKPPKDRFEYSLSVTNAGPSRASTAIVEFAAYTLHLNTREGKTFVITGTGVEFGKCGQGPAQTYYKGTSYTGYKISCPVAGGWDPGQTRTYKIIFSYKDPGGAFFEEFPVSWGGGGDLGDPKPGNSITWRLTGACRPARPPKCG